MACLYTGDLLECQLTTLASSAQRLVPFASEVRARVAFFFGLLGKHAPCLHFAARYFHQIELDSRQFCSFADLFRIVWPDFARISLEMPDVGLFRQVFCKFGFSLSSQAALRSLEIFEFYLISRRLASERDALNDLFKFGQHLT